MVVRTEGIIEFVVLFPTHGNGFDDIQARKQIDGSVDADAVGARALFHDFGDCQWSAGFVEHSKNLLARRGNS